MKYNIYIIILFLVYIGMSCTDADLGKPSGPFRLIVEGPTSVKPETTVTYLLGPYDKPETYSWTVDGPAQIVGATTGSSIKVKFTSVGAVNLKVTNGTDSGVVPITVQTVKPTVKVTLNDPGVLKSGVKDTVFLTFPAALMSTPVIKMLASTDSSHITKKKLAFNSGSIAPIFKVDDKHYYVIYTPGTGNGTPEALITGLKSNAAYGSIVLDSVYISLYKVDNIAPLAALSYSASKASDGTVVTVTAKFTEPVVFEDPLDSAILISFSGVGVTAETDTLIATDDPLVYTFDYTVNDSGDGPITATLTNVIDVAGNPLANTTNETGLVADNTGPVVVGLATDGGGFATLEITSSETGTTNYIILKNTAPAPTDVDKFFGATAVASGSSNVTAGDMVTLAKIVATGSYKVYFISQDEAGNYSSITSVPLVMN